MLLHRSTFALHFHRLSLSPPPYKLLSQSNLSCSSLLLNWLSSSSSSSSSFPRKTVSLWLIEPRHSRTHRRGRGFATSAASAAVAGRSEGETFFADEGISWKSLGVSDRLSRALFGAGIERPSLVQAASIPSILSGKDVIIAAETGSGKTHSYLVPLMERLCSMRLSSEHIGADEESTSDMKALLIICPNIMLCEQVVRMASSLCGENGEALVSAAAVCGQNGWPTNKQDIIVSTPAALLNNIEHKSRCTDFIQGVKYVVFDEADLLLCGSFQNQVIRLINMLWFDEKLLSRNKNSVLNQPVVTDPNFTVSLPLEGDEESDAAISDQEEDYEDVDSAEVREESEAGVIKKRDWRRVRKFYERSKQYIFVAATLPTNGKKTAGAVLKKMFPEASWVSGNYLHYHNPRLEHRWIKVNIDTQVDALIEAVNEGHKSNLSKDSSGVTRTMVFANTVEAVEAVANILERADIQCFRYHKDRSLQQRAETVNDFREKGGIFVCTDAAARGLDIPNVSHVIQADFATSAVDFLHRVGRTGRAGQCGMITNLYTQSNQDLVEAVCQAGKLGQPLETAFSRKRSFRNKLKKRGLSKMGASGLGMAQV